MNIQLSDHFTTGRLLRFTLPSIIMMIFTSVYSIVDGLFVANCVGTTAFAAVNLVMPLLMVMGCVGFMIGTGGSAIVAKKLGEGKKEEAQRLFSLFVVFGFVCGVIIAATGYIYIRPLCEAFGAQGQMLEDCVAYASVLFISVPFFTLQYAFQTFFVAAEKPVLGLIVIVIAGVTNIILDTLLVWVFDFGLMGAAYATMISEVLGGSIPIIYFIRKNTSLLRLVKPRFSGKALVKVCTNGSSELASSVSMSVVGMLYNGQLMKYAGENGVAAYGVIMYVNMIFLSAFCGYSQGSAPVISFHFGAKNIPELKNLFKRSITIILIFSVSMFALAEIFASPITSIFVGYDETLFDLTVNAFRIFAFSYLLSGMAIYGSSFFTALNDGLTSALISFLRTMVFQVLAVMLLPLIFGIDGIWYSIITAEIMAVILTVIFFFVKRKKFRYF